MLMKVRSTRDDRKMHTDQTCFLSYIKAKYKYICHVLFRNCQRLDRAILTRTLVFENLNLTEHIIQLDEHNA